MKRLLEEELAPSPAWTMAYGDLMSLLLTFFVMLVSMSEIRNSEKYRGVADALHDKFSARGEPAGIDPGIGRPRNSRLAAQAASARATREQLLAELSQLPSTLGPPSERAPVPRAAAEGRLMNHTENIITR